MSVIHVAFSFLYLSLHFSISQYIHSSFPWWGALSLESGGFLSGNLLKASLGKIFMEKKYTRLIRLNHEEQPIHTNEELKIWPIFRNEMLVWEGSLL